jgi:hypothetical protein
VTDLPLVDAAPAKLPQALATSYVELDLRALEPDKAVVVGVRVDPDLRWSAAVLLFHGDRTADEHPVTLDSAGNGHVRLENLAGHPRLLLAVTNLGTDTHDANDPNCRDGGILLYSLSVVDSRVEPRVEAVDPPTVTTGESAYVWVYGGSFLEGLNAAVGGGGVVVSAVDWIDDATLGLSLVVAADAAPGARDVTVTNPRGEAATLAGALTVAGTPAKDAEKEDGAGCACAARTGLPGPGAGLLLLVAAGRGWRRRRG